MEIINIRKLPIDVPKALQPLFEAMSRGERIKSVTCMMGLVNKDYRENDFILEDFTATLYEVAINQQFDNSWCDDLVITDIENPIHTKDPVAFYMNWVVSFEL